MDLRTLFGLILFLIVVLSIILIYKNRIKREKKIIQELFDFAGENNCNVSAYDHWRNTLIGVDNLVHKLFIIRRTQDYELKKVINLSEIKKCNVVRTTRTAGEGKTKQSVIERIELALTFSKKTILRFY